MTGFPIASADFVQRKNTIWFKTGVFGMSKRYRETDSNARVSLYVLFEIAWECGEQRSSDPTAVRLAEGLLKVYEAEIRAEQRNG